MDPARAQPGTGPSLLPAVERRRPMPEVPGRDAAHGALRVVLDRLPCAVLVIEPVGIETVAHGHGLDAADHCTRVVSTHCRQVLGRGLLGEHGAGRLLAVVPAVGPDPAARAHAAVRELGATVHVRLPGADRVVAVVRLAVGVAIADADDALEDVLAAADHAVVRSVRQNTTVVLREPGAGAAARRRLRLATDLAEGLHRPDLRMVYQPIVDLRTGALVKAEALLRWHHPDLGAVPPPEVMAVAHEAGLTSAITEALAQRVAGDARGWAGTHHTPLPIAFNLSAEQLTTVSPGDLLGVLADGVAPEHLTIEVTEQSVPEDVGDAVARLEAYRRAGAQVALDDFGAGYASLGYLRQLPADQVKLDRAFVAELGQVDDAHGGRAFAELLQAVVRGLGLVSVAEGVENLAQLQLLTDMGTDLGQGWLFGHGVPMVELAASRLATGE